jgi:acetyltransferase-like isoleucine patch superfamily enzyme
VKLSKFFWAVRLFFYSIFYKEINFPGYLGRPILLLGFNKVKLGKYVRIFPNSRFEVHGDAAYIHIHEDVSIGQGFHVTSKGPLNICSGTVISGNVIVTNIDHEYTDITKPILKQPYIINETYISENCFIGYGVVIQAGTKLGKHCIVGANSVVRGHYPDYCVLVGSPARVVKRYNHEQKKWIKNDK